MRVMGIDFGTRRLGVALSDPTGTLASPLQVVSRRAGKRVPLKALERIAADRDVGQLVIGLPLDLDGRETPWCAEIRKAGDELSSRLNVPVAYVDERMSSVRAERRVRTSGLPRGKREEKGRIDEAAAAIILQSWLDRNGSPEEGP